MRRVGGMRVLATEARAGWRAVRVGPGGAVQILDHTGRAAQGCRWRLFLADSEMPAAHARVTRRARHHTAHHTC